MALTIAERMAAGRQQQPRKIQMVDSGSSNAATVTAADSRSAQQIAEQHEQEASEFRERFRNFNWGSGSSL